jgi:hypothetical protein
MSVDNIYNDLYNFLINDWKNTSLIIEKDSTHKTFPIILKKFIEYSSERSQYGLDLEALTYFQNNLLDGISNKHIQNIFDNMTARYEDLLHINNIDFSEQLVAELSKNNNYINLLRPKGWEQFILAHKNKPIDLTTYNELWSPKRSEAFKGHQFPEDDFGFYDKISLFVTAKKYNEQGIQPHITLFKSISKYVFSYNKKNNTNELIRNIDDLLDAGLSTKNINHYMSKYLHKDDIKLDFEIIDEKEKSKEDLNNMLKKLTKKSN